MKAGITYFNKFINVTKSRSQSYIFVTGLKLPTRVVNTLIYISVLEYTSLSLREILDLRFSLGIY